MRLFDRAEPAKGLSDVLDRERQAILKGDYAALASLASEKERHYARIARDRPGADRLSSLQIKASRNQVLLTAAADGIRSVVRDLNESRQPTTLKTYDRAGSRCTTFGDSHSLERRY